MSVVEAILFSAFKYLLAADSERSPSFSSLLISIAVTLAVSFGVGCDNFNHRVTDEQALSLGLKRG